MDGFQRLLQNHRPPVLFYSLLPCFHHRAATEPNTWFCSATITNNSTESRRQSVFQHRICSDTETLEDCSHRHADPKTYSMFCVFIETKLLRTPLGPEHWTENTQNNMKLLLTLNINRIYSYFKSRGVKSTFLIFVMLVFTLQGSVCEDTSFKLRASVCDETRTRRRHPEINFLINNL